MGATSLVAEGREDEDRGQSICVYAFNTPCGYLVDSVWPAACVIHASLADLPGTVLARVPEQTTHFLFHCDLTHTSSLPMFRDLLIGRLQESGIVVLNGHVTDISKRALAAAAMSAGAGVLLAQPHGPGSELLFAKSNLNCGGIPERRAGLQSKTCAVASALAGAGQYALLERREVPTSWWSCDQIVIERFVTNKPGRFYRAYVCGRHVIVSRATSEATIKTMGCGRPRHNLMLDLESHECPETIVASPLHTVVDQVRRIIRQVGVHFGAVDVLEDDLGNAYVCDLNITPF